MIKGGREEYIAEVLIEDDGGYLGEATGEWKNISIVFHIVSMADMFRDIYDTFNTLEEARIMLNMAFEYQEKGATYVRFDRGRIRKRTITPYETVEVIDL